MAKKPKTDRQRKKRGRKPKALRADGVDWQDAMKHALKKPKPKDGWEEGESATEEENSPPSRS